VILGALFLGERLSPGLVAGGALIVVAVILTTRRPVKPAPAAAHAAQPTADEPTAPGPLAVPQYKR
jgi:hypothetical protein